MSHRDHPDGVEPAIPDDNAPLPPARRGTRWTVRRGRSIAFVLVGLALGVSLLSVYATYQAARESAARAAAVDERLAVLEEDLADRTRQRDQERDAGAARDAEFSAYLCSVLSQLPEESQTLEQLRRALGCQQRGTATPAPAPGSDTSSPAGSSSPGPARPPPADAQQRPAPPSDASASPASPSPTAASPPAPDPPPVDGSAPPLLDLTPLTDPLCEALSLCA